MDSFKLPKDAFFMLLDSNVPTLQRLKLARVLWNTTDFHLPNKYQSLLDWLLRHITTADKASDAKESDELWICLHEFMLSETLQLFLGEKNKSIEVKLSSFQLLIRKVQKTGTIDLFIRLLETALEWLLKAVITCPARANVNLQFDYLSELLNALQRNETWYRSSKFDEAAMLLSKTIDHQMTVLGTYTETKIIKLIFSCSLDKLLCCVLNTISNLDSQGQTQSQTQLIHSLRSILKCTIFSKESSAIHDSYTGNKPENSSHLNAEVKKLALNLKEKIQLLISSNSNAAIVELCKLYLESYEENLSKFHWVRNLVHELVEQKDKQTSSQLQALPGILKLILTHNLYNPTLYKTMDQRVWLNKITQQFIVNSGVNEQFCESLLVLLKTDKAIVETILQSVLTKLLALEDEFCKLTLQDIAEYYVSVRQPQKLLKFILLSLKSSNTKSFDHVRYIAMRLSQECAEKQSASVNLELWSLVQEQIMEEMNCNKEWTASFQIYLSSALIICCEIIKNVRLLDVWNYTLQRNKLCGILLMVKKKILPNLIKQLVSSSKPDQALLSVVMETCTVFCSAYDMLSSFAIKQLIPVASTPALMFYANNLDSIEYSNLVHIEKHCCKLKLWEKFLGHFTASNSIELGHSLAKWCFFKLGQLQRLKQSLLFLPKLQVQNCLRPGDNFVDIMKEISSTEDAVSDNVLKCLQSVKDSLPSDSRIAQEDIFDLVSKHINKLSSPYQHKTVVWILDLLIQKDINNSDLPFDGIFKKMSSSGELSSIGINHLQGYLETSIKKLKNTEIEHLLTLDTFEEYKFATSQDNEKNLNKVCKNILHILKHVQLDSLHANASNHCLGLLTSLLKVDHQLVETNRPAILKLLAGLIKMDASYLTNYRNLLENLCLYCAKYIDCSSSASCFTILLKYFMCKCDSLLPDDRFKKLVTFMKSECKVMHILVETIFEFLSQNMMINKVKENESAFETYLHSSIQQSRKRKIKQLEIPKVQKKSKIFTEELLKMMKTLFKEIKKANHEKDDIHLHSTFMLSVLSMHLCGVNVDIPTDTFSTIKEKFGKLMQKLKNENCQLSNEEMKFLTLCGKLSLLEPSLKLHSKKEWGRMMTNFILSSNLMGESHQDVISSLLFVCPSSKVLKDFLNKSFENISLDNNISGHLQILSIVATTPWKNITKMIDDDETVAKEFLTNFTKGSITKLTSSIKALSKKISHDLTIEDCKLLSNALSCYFRMIENQQVSMSSLDASIVFSLLHIVPLSQIATIANSSNDKQLTNIFENVFKSCTNILAHLMSFKQSVANWIPLIIMSYSRLFKSVVLLGKHSASLDEEIVSACHRCAKEVERKVQFLEHNFTREIGKCSASLISEFILSICQTTIYLSVKTILLQAIYYLMSMLDDYTVAVLRTNLPLGVRDVFHKIYGDFCKYHKYKGFV